MSDKAEEPVDETTKLVEDKPVEEPLKETTKLEKDKPVEATL